MGKTAKKIRKKRSVKRSKPFQRNSRKFHNQCKTDKNTREEYSASEIDDSDVKESDDENAALSMDCEEYEKYPRQNNQVMIRNLLPVKSKKGLEFRSEVVQHQQVVTQEKKTESNLINVIDDLNSATFVQSYALQQQKLDALKTNVAMLCTSVIEDPENNMKALRELITLLQNRKAVLLVSEKSIVSLSLLHVFSDILPGYKIVMKEETDTKIKLKKETIKLINYEQSLLRYYKKYIDCLQIMVQKMKTKKTAQQSMVKKKAVREIGIVATKCLSELLATRFTFNYFKNILHILVSVTSNKDKEVASICCQAYEKVFIADKLGEYSLDIVKVIVKMTKERMFSVPECLIQTFLCLNLREASRKPASLKPDMTKLRKELNSMSRTDKRQRKKTLKTVQELRETEAEENVENVSKFHTETLNKVFWVYFHVLKDGRKISLISPVLEGLSNFARLINLEFFDDLSKVLSELMENGSLQDIEKLHCMHTLFTILSGQAESLNIDPHKIYCYMYQILLKLCRSQLQKTEQIDLTMKCLNSMILSRKKCITSNRILAFIKRLSTVTLQTNLHGTLGLLSCMRVLLLNIKGSDILLDSESMIGSGMYLPELEDPEYCNAQTTALWELYFLKRHYNPITKLYSNHILYSCPNQGRLSLPEILLKSSPEETLNLLTGVSDYHIIDGFEGTEGPPKKKFKSNFNSNPITAFEDYSCELSWKTVNNANFICSNIEDSN